MVLNLRPFNESRKGEVQGFWSRTEVQSRQTVMYHLIFLIYFVRTSFSLDPKTGLGFGPTSLKNKFVERGRKN